MARIADTTMSGQENTTRQLRCPACGSELPRGATECRACRAKVSQPEGTATESREVPAESVPHGRRHGQRGRSVRASKRYVYGKRKEGLSAEMVWLLLVIILGLLLILGAHLLAFMRARKLVETPSPPVPVVCCCYSSTKTAWGNPEVLSPASLRLEIKSYPILRRYS